MPKRRALFWVLLCGCGMLLSACTSWVRQSSPPDAVLRERTPRLVRVTMVSGAIVEVANPKVQRDSLFGLLPHSAAPGAPLRTFQASLDSVGTMYLKESSLARTASLVVVVPSLVAGSLFLMGF